jgi:hypothetical protein
VSDERRALRELGEWRPQSILRRLGPAPEEPHYLAYLMVALTVLHGPERVHALFGRLESEGRRLLPRLLAVVEQEGLDRALLEDTHAELTTLCRELGPVRARVANEPRGGVPVGMNTGDLKFIARFARAVIAATELVTRPSPAGVARTKRLLSRPPIMADALAWARRLLPAGTRGAAMLAQGGGRVLVVFGDGQIAYDPLAAPEDDGAS